MQLSADDYHRYYAIIGKRQSSWSNIFMFAAALFAATAVAFAFRALASLETTDRVAIEIVGRYSLFAYAVGVFAIVLLASVQRRRSISSTLASTPHAFDAKTVVLDDDAVSIAGTLSNVRYTWPAFTQLTVTRQRLCLWIGAQSAVLVPVRAFASDEERRSAIAFIERKIAGARRPG